MLHYKIIAEDNGIILLKKNNKFKLDIKSRVNISCDILTRINNNTFYDLLTKINNDTLKECRVKSIDNEKTNIFLVLNEIDEDEDEKLYISFTNKIKYKSEDNIIIIGTMNNLIINEPNYKKIDINNLLINVKLVDDKLSIKLKVLYVGEKLPIFSENMIGHIFKKLFKRLVLYYS
jgi:hypothetical protein